MTAKERIVRLLKEPSTYAGLAALLGAATTLGMSEDHWIQILSAFAILFGAMATVILDPGDIDTTVPTQKPTKK